MKVRVMTAVVGILAVLVLVWLGSWFLTGAIAIVSLMALFEYDRMLKNIGIHIYPKMAGAAVVLMVLAAGFYSLRLFLGSILLLFPLLLYPILAIHITKDDMGNLIYTAFGALYFGIGFGALAILRGIHELIPATEVAIDPGIFLILFVLVCTWASDSFAYLVGKRWGKHKMAPRISPNKTMEGLAGGAVGCVVLGVALCFAVGFNPIHGAILSVVAAIMAPMGDLFESFVKRACDIKDSGNILPGHGGMMDRFDSLLFVAPALTAVLTFVR